MLLRQNYVTGNNKRRLGHRVSVKYFCLILTKFGVERFEKKWPKQNFTEICPVEVAMTHEDGLAEVTKVIGPFRDYAKQPNKIEGVKTDLYEDKCVHKYTMTYYRIQCLRL